LFKPTFLYTEAKLKGLETTHRILCIQPLVKYPEYNKYKRGIMISDLGLLSLTFKLHRRYQ